MLAQGEGEGDGGSEGEVLLLASGSDLLPRLAFALPRTDLYNELGSIRYEALTTRGGYAGERWVLPHPCSDSHPFALGSTLFGGSRQICRADAMLHAPRGHGQSNSSQHHQNYSAVATRFWRLEWQTSVRIPLDSGSRVAEAGRAPGMHAGDARGSRGAPVYYFT